MFVELVYDKRNFDGLPGAKGIILGNVKQKNHNIAPNEEVRVNPIITFLGPRFYFRIYSYS